MGHYGEPNSVIAHEFNPDAAQKSLYLLEYNPQSGEWQTSKQSDLA